MNRAPMLTRSSNAPYGALSASIIFSSFRLGWMRVMRLQAGAVPALGLVSAFSRIRMRFFGLADKAGRGSGCLGLSSCAGARKHTITCVFGPEDDCMKLAAQTGK